MRSKRWRMFRRIRTATCSWPKVLILHPEFLLRLLSSSHLRCTAGGTLKQLIKLTRSRNMECQMKVTTLTLKPLKPLTLKP